MKPSADAQPTEPVHDSDEACCRICLMELSSSSSMQLECSCKGEMALVHRECAIQWFSISRDALCDVCNRHVANIPPLPALKEESFMSLIAAARRSRYRQDPEYEVLRDRVVFGVREVPRRLGKRLLKLAKRAFGSKPTPPAPQLPQLDH